MPTTMTFEDPLLEGFRRPEAMAIGDSIFNGVRSLTTDAGLAALSPPAQCARAFGLPFISPDYPRPVLFDVEQTFREGRGLLDLIGLAVANAGEWLAEPRRWSSTPFFDNISIAGATIGDLTAETFAAHDPNLSALLAAVTQANGIGAKIEAVAKLYYALNAAFLLNPTRDERLAQATPVDLVALRRPKRLFINIGSNEGLFGAGITAEWTDAVKDSIASIPGKLALLAEALQPAVAGVDHVYFNLLIRPRTLANLWTRGDDAGNIPPGCDAYFDHYAGRLAGISEMTGAEMKEFDDLVLGVNQQAQAVVGGLLGADKVRFVDLYALGSRHDGKHGCEEAELWLQLHRHSVRLTNKPLSTDFGFKYGGIFGLDNMHPTTVGYALLAQEMAAAVTAAEGLPVRQPISLQAALDADTLLQNLPRHLVLRSFLYNLLASLYRVGSGPLVA